jgi:hypothetical protein
MDQPPHVTSKGHRTATVQDADVVDQVIRLVGTFLFVLLGETCDEPPARP